MSATCRWSCDRCHEIYDVARMACRKCGTFAPPKVLAQALEEWKRANPGWELRAESAYAKAKHRGI